MSDGPVMIGTPITFTAVYHPFEGIDDNHGYKFVFEDEIRGEAREIITRNRNVSLTYIFYEGEGSLTYPRMEVRVYQVIDESRFLLVAKNEIAIQVTEDIPGWIEIYQSDIHNPGVVTPNETVTLIAKVNDPSGYFNNWTMSYRWMVDNQTLQSMTQNIANYTFERYWTYKVRAFLTARNVSQIEANATILDKAAQKFGQFVREIWIPTPMGELNVKGKMPMRLIKSLIKHLIVPLIHRTGDRVLKDGRLGLMITCQQGSVPYEWCWGMFTPCFTTSNISHLPMILNLLNYLFHPIPIKTIRLRLRFLLVIDSTILILTIVHSSLSISSRRRELTILGSWLKTESVSSGNSLSSKPM